MILGCITTREWTIHGTKVSSVLYRLYRRLKLEELMDITSSLHSLTTPQAMRSLTPFELFRTTSVCLAAQRGYCNGILLFRLTAAGTAARFLSKLPQQMTTLLKV